MIEQVFGWMKTVGGLRKLRHRGGAETAGGTFDTTDSGPAEGHEDEARQGATSSQNDPSLDGLSVPTSPW